MLQVDNNTPFGAAIVPSRNKADEEFLTVVIKGQFDIAVLQNSLSIAEEQTDPVMSDTYWGDPEGSSVRYEADSALVKTGIDILLNGAAYAPDGKAVSALDVSLQAGDVKKTLRVVGDRYWHKERLNWVVSEVTPFERMFLVYENAYGGVDKSLADTEFPAHYEYNPIGKGYVSASGGTPIEGLALPNIEHPASLIRRWDERPEPAGFGPVSRSWLPRRQYAGTYDEQWQQTRMPLLPHDFNDAYFNAASAGLVMPFDFANDGWIALENVVESGNLSFVIPKIKLNAAVRKKGKRVNYIPQMDTVLIEPDDKKVTLCWRISVPCTRELLYIDNVTLDWRVG